MHSVQPKDGSPMSTAAFAPERVAIVGAVVVGFVTIKILGRRGR